MGPRSDGPHCSDLGGFRYGFIGGYRPGASGLGPRERLILCGPSGHRVLAQLQPHPRGPLAVPAAASAQHTDAGGLRSSTSDSLRPRGPLWRKGGREVPLPLACYV